MSVGGPYALAQDRNKSACVENGGHDVLRIRQGELPPPRFVAEHHVVKISLEVEEGLWGAHTVGLPQVERLLVSFDAADHDRVPDVASGKVVCEDLPLDPGGFRGAVPQGIDAVGDDILHAKLPGYSADWICNVHDNNLDLGSKN